MKMGWIDFWCVIVAITVIILNAIGEIDSAELKDAPTTNLTETEFLEAVENAVRNITQINEEEEKVNADKQTWSEFVMDIIFIFTAFLLILGVVKKIPMIMMPLIVTGVMSVILNTYHLIYFWFSGRRLFALILDLLVTILAIYYFWKMDAPVDRASTSSTSSSSKKRSRFRVGLWKAFTRYIK